MKITIRSVIVTLICFGLHARASTPTKNCESVLGEKPYFEVSDQSRLDIERDLREGNLESLRLKLNRLINENIGRLFYDIPVADPLVSGVSANLPQESYENSLVPSARVLEFLIRKLDEISVQLDSGIWKQLRSRHQFKKILRDYDAFIEVNVVSPGSIEYMANVQMYAWNENDRHLILGDSTHIQVTDMKPMIQNIRPNSSVCARPFSVN